MPPRKSNKSKQRRNGRPAISGKDVVRLHRLPKIEVKQINVSAHQVAYYDAVAGSVLVDVTAIGQGVSGATRVGDSCRLQQLLFRGYNYNQVVANSQSTLHTRIVFFQYMADSSVAGKPTVAELFNASNANGGGPTYGTWSAFDIDYAAMYHVLYDHVYQTFGSPAGLTSTLIGTSFMWDTFVPLNRAQRDINFQAGTSTGSNHIYMMITSDQASTANNPVISYNLDVRFTDT